MVAINNSLVRGSAEEEATQIKRTKKYFWFFNVEWWETVSVENIGHDIHIKTDRPIRAVYLNGNKIN